MDQVEATKERSLCIRRRNLRFERSKAKDQNRRASTLTECWLSQNNPWFLDRVSKQKFPENVDVDFLGSSTESEHKQDIKDRCFSMQPRVIDPHSHDIDRRTGHSSSKAGCKWRDKMCSDGIGMAESTDQLFFHPVVHSQFHTTDNGSPLCCRQNTLSAEKSMPRHLRDWTHVTYTPKTSNTFFSRNRSHRWK